MKAHLDHPTQATACGTRATQTGLTESKFRASANQCKSCARTLAALDAGRPAYRGIEPAAFAAGTAAVVELFDALKRRLAK